MPEPTMNQLQLGVPAPKLGWTYEQLMSDGLCQKQFISEILTQPYSLGHLYDEAVLPRQTINALDGRFAYGGMISVDTDVGEAEVRPSHTADFKYMDARLTKDVAKFTITDEALIRGKNAIISPQDYFLSREGEAFLHALDQRIYRELNNSPMKMYWNASKVDRPSPDPGITTDFMENIVPEIWYNFEQSNRAPTAMMLNFATYTKLFSTLNRDYHGLGTYDDNFLPGLRDIKVIKCNLIRPGEIYFVSNQVPGILLLEFEEVKSYSHQDIDIGQFVMRIDVFRQVISNLYQREFNETRPQKVHKNLQNDVWTSKTVADPYMANSGVLKLRVHGFEAPADKNEIWADYFGKDIANTAQKNLPAA